MKPLSTRSGAVKASATLEINALAKSLRAQGKDVISFSVGEPDFPTPDYIKEAAFQAIRENKTLYTPAAGIPELRQAVCLRMKEDCGLDYLPENVVVASGAKHVVYLALHAILNPEDEVIIPAPEWVSYVEMVRLAFGRPVLVYTTEQSDFKLTAAALEAAITDRTKCLILNSPCNPTGMVYSAAELAEIARVCQKYDLYVIADEIYYNLLYDNRSFVSFASLNEDAKNRTILVNGVSKSYAMTGWRVGYSLAGTEISGIMSRYVSHSTAAPSTISQWAAVAALTGPQDSREEMRKAFEQRRNYIVERVNAIPGVSCLKPQGAFYIMMNLSRLIGKHLYGVEITDGNVFAKLLLEKGLVAVVPGSAFDAPDYVRWSYAAGIDTIRVGMDRLEAFLKNA